MNKTLPNILLTLCCILLLSACSLSSGKKAEDVTALPATPPPDAAALTQSAETIIAQITQSSLVTPALTAIAEDAAGQLSENASPTPMAESLTPTGPTPLPSTTPIPTMTFTPTLTLTASITPSPTWIPEDPRAEFTEPGWSANFRDDATWYTFDKPSASILMKNGELLLSAKNSAIIEIWSLSWPKLENFYLEYTFVVGERCIGEDRYGMLFRSPDPNNGYLFGVNCKGEFSLRFWDGAAFDELVPWTASEYINTGGGAANRLGVRAEGENLNLYINGRLVSNVADPLSSEGKFGAFIKADLVDGFDVRILEVIYWELP